METTPEEFNLTEEDIQKTEQKIAEFDLAREQYVLSVIPQKLEALIQTNLNAFVVQLINDVSRLYNIIMTLNDLDENLKRRILYALDYFVDEDDEIPDEIPDLGYLDDLVIVRYVVDQIMSENSDLFQA